MSDTYQQKDLHHDFNSDVHVVGLGAGTNDGLASGFVDRNQRVTADDAKEDDQGDLEEEKSPGSLGQLTSCFRGNLRLLSNLLLSGSLQPFYPARHNIRSAILKYCKNT
jgi:hypothetical protein